MPLKVPLKDLTCYSVFYWLELIDSLKIFLAVVKPRLFGRLWLIAVLWFIGDVYFFNPFLRSNSVHRGPPRSIAGHRGSQRSTATAVNVIITAVYRRRQRIIAIHCGLPRSTAVHRGPIITRSKKLVRIKKRHYRLSYTMFFFSFLSDSFRVKRNWLKKTQ